MNSKFRLAIIFLMIGMITTVIGSILKIMEITFANTIMMFGLVAHFMSAGILVFSLIDNRKLS